MMVLLQGNILLVAFGNRKSASRGPNRAQFSILLISFLTSKDEEAPSPFKGIITYQF